MTAIEIAAAIAKHFEGYRARPYLCPARVPTIGFGSTRYPDGRKVNLSDPPISIDVALELLFNELTINEIKAIKYCPVLLSNDNRRAAITDFVYNLGAGRLQTSTLRRRINQQNWPAAKKELLKWVYGGGRKLPGLVLRREAEAKFLM